MTKYWLSAYLGKVNTLGSRRSYKKVDKLLSQNFLSSWWDNIWTCLKKDERFSWPGCPKWGTGLWRPRCGSPSPGRLLSCPAPFSLFLSLFFRESYPTPEGWVLENLVKAPLWSKYRSCMLMGLMERAVKKTCRPQGATVMQYVTPRWCLQFLIFLAMSCPTLHAGIAHLRNF